jgi:hypothetical protein
MGQDEVFGRHSNIHGIVDGECDVRRIQIFARHVDGVAVAGRRYGSGDYFIGLGWDPLAR